MANKYFGEVALTKLIKLVKQADSSITNTIGTVPSGTTVEAQISALAGTHSQKADGTYNTVANEAKTAIEALDAVISSTDGGDIAVKVTEVDGKITTVNVTGISECTEKEITDLFST